MNEFSFRLLWNLTTYLFHCIIPKLANSKSWMPWLGRFKEYMKSFWIGWVMMGWIVHTLAFSAWLAKWISKPCKWKSSAHGEKDVFNGGRSIIMTHFHLIICLASSSRSKLNSNNFWGCRMSDWAKNWLFSCPRIKQNNCKYTL